MILHTVVTGPLEVNCYLVGCEKTNKAAVIDPGGNAERIVSVIDDNKLANRPNSLDSRLTRRHRSTISLKVAITSRSVRLIYGSSTLPGTLWEVFAFWVRARYSQATWFLQEPSEGQIFREAIVNC